MLDACRVDTVKSSTDWPPAVSVVNEAGGSDVVLICEHASNHLPAEYGRLGVSEADLQRHIAWDIGAAEVTLGLSRALDAPAFLGTYSRLLVDLNRPFGVPSSMPARSEATDIPGNRELCPAERERRRRLMFQPFHDRIASFLDARAETERPTRIVTIHSYTPVFLGERRPWHAGILFERSEAFARQVIEGLAEDRSLLIGTNVPYGIDRAEDYAIPVHGTDRGHPAILVEIRHDLIADERGVAEWTERLRAVLA
ncbi:N-formylglutamate amidohydrolase [Geminicoccus roseus]|uniref:N-formylglutamate amidohydrolase n=1 Tax=Geminicoccus roseus TaxID=404900 RepID=UPI0003FE3361|nr:N-formylglutamate amidohydrolase [Geminicoccus roseus]